jgi:hypothetical protein
MHSIIEAEISVGLMLVGATVNFFGSHRRMGLDQKLSVSASAVPPINDDIKRLILKMISAKWASFGGCIG